MQTLKEWELYSRGVDYAEKTISLGPPGTGKTMFPQVWAKNHNWYLVSSFITQDASTADLIGAYKVGDNGKFVWEDGEITHAWRESHNGHDGVLLRIDDIHEASDEVLAALLAGLGDFENAMIRLPGGEVIRPNPDKLKVVATMNGDIELLAAPLRDRFHVRVKIQTPNPAAVDMLDLDLQELAKNFIGDVSRSGEAFSLRAFFAFQKMRGVAGDDVSAQLVFGAQAEAIVDALKIAQAGSGGKKFSPPLPQAKD